ncbi:hypothetical protein [Microbacterium elymi]|uniref:Uncharacterized protein n=1 Tax=Microbacterium elymi TaxID=2909587 RepID=A0ABY5NJ91_9MICO|nr:hypothetical protein [Microbacterium elymi]UUT35239.1 hypothetical protein L2X98_34105 [Microbacterium elymi]
MGPTAPRSIRAPTVSSSRRIPLRRPRRKPFEAPSADPGPFLSYGIQWIMFAVMGFIFIWYVIRSERRARREEAEDAAAIAALAVTDPEAAQRLRDETTVRRARAKRAAHDDRDSQDEDALLDRAGR